MISQHNLNSLRSPGFAETLSTLFLFFLTPQSCFVFDLIKQTAARHVSTSEILTIGPRWDFEMFKLCIFHNVGWLANLFRLQSLLYCTSPNLSLLIFPISNEKKKSFHRRLQLSWEYAAGRESFFSFLSSSFFLLAFTRLFVLLISLSLEHCSSGHWYHLLEPFFCREPPDNSVTCVQRSK